MAVVRSPITLGDCLVREGVITQAQLHQAREEQLATARSLGRILVERGIISEAARMGMLKKRLGFEVISLKDEPIEPLLLLLIPFGFAEKHRAVPVRKDESGTLVVAMEDPSDEMVIEAMRAQLGMPVRPVVAANEEIEAVLEQYGRLQMARAERAAHGYTGRPLWYRALKAGLFPVLMIAPLALLFVALYLDLFDIQALVQGLGNWDLALYIGLIWGTWTMIMFEVTGLIFAEKPAGPETEEGDGA